MHRLDHDASDILKEFITEQHIDYQLTPASYIWCNWAERIIQISIPIVLQFYDQLIQIPISIYGTNQLLNLS